MTMDKKSLRRHWPSWPFVGVLAALLFIFTAAFIYFGIYNIAADAPHTKPVYALLESLRDRSITVHARGIAAPKDLDAPQRVRSEEHTSELQSLMRISYAVFCLKKKKTIHNMNIEDHRIIQYIE